MKTLIDYLLAILKIVLCIGAYALASFLLGLIHPMAPSLVLLVAVVGFVAHIIVDTKRMGEASAKATAEFEANMAKARASLEVDVDLDDEPDPDAEFKAWRDRRTQAWFEAMKAETDRRLRAEFEAERASRTFDVEADHTQCDDSEDDEPAPLVRYSEHDPVQRA